MLQFRGAAVKSDEQMTMRGDEETFHVLQLDRAAVMLCCSDAVLQLCH